MAHKVEHAVDMHAGAVVAVTLHGGTTHDTKSLDSTVEAAATNLGEVREKLSAKTKSEAKDDDGNDDEPGSPVAEQIQEVVADKGYHSNKALCDMDESLIRTYIAEPKRARRNWKKRQTEKRLVYNTSGESRAAAVAS